MDKTAIEILCEGLRAGGYDGLFNPDMECGCDTDDLAPCGEIELSGCVAGVKAACTKDCAHECADEPGVWHIERRMNKTWGK